MESFNDSGITLWGYEPQQNEDEEENEDEDNFSRFMEPLHTLGRTHWNHEPIEWQMANGR